MHRILVLITILLPLSINVFGQFKYDSYDNILSYSYCYPIIDSLKKNHKINVLQLPAFNNDSLFWVNNIKYLNPKNESRYPGLVRICGFPRDTIISFFEVATKIKIKEGYIWLYKITSPTAFSLGVHLKNLELNPEDYISAHSNFHDSTGGPLLYRQPEVLAGDDLKKEMQMKPHFLTKGYPLNIFIGNDMYIEIFSPNESIQKSELKIISWTYEYPTRYGLSDAPKWVREKYPEIDFDYYKKRN